MQKFGSNNTIFYLSKKIQKPHYKLKKLIPQSAKQQLSHSQNLSKLPTHE